MKERKTPLMGWASWNAFRTNINEETIKEQAKLLDELGLKDLGYTYVNIDDGYFGGRDENGKLKFRPDRFPNGLKGVVDYIHSRGLQAGIYSDGGENTCASYFDTEGDNGRTVGLYGHEEEDLSLFFRDNDFDFIKVDWCGGLHLGLDEEEQYTKISNIIKSLSKELDRDLIFNICRWQFPGEWVTDNADSWRIAGDIVPEFDSVLYEIDSAKPFYNYNGPGHVNDLDMLEVGNGMSNDEDQAHFAMWCMMSTPLMIGCDLREIRLEALEILKNKELIDLNQDSASLAAYVISRENKDGKIMSEVWLKDLGKEGSGSKAIAFLNRSEEPVDLTQNLKEAGLEGKILSIRDLIEHEDLEPEENISVTLRPHQIKVFKIEAENGSSPENLDKQNAYIPFEYERVGQDELEEKLDKGAVLIDVRTPEEFEEGHLDRAVNVPYINFHWLVSSMEPYRNQEIILTCRTGKRAEQVYQILKYNGFDNVKVFSNK